MTDPQTRTEPAPIGPQPQKGATARFFASRLWRWGREILVIVALFAAVLWWQTRDMLPADGGVQIPPFTLPTLDGTSMTVVPDAQRDTLVYFFAPWCGICRSTAPHLQNVDRTRSRVVVIALDYRDRIAVQEFVEATGLTHPVLLGTEQTRSLFQVQAYPTYYLLDQQFRVTGRAMGYLTAPGLLMR